MAEDGREKKRKQGGFRTMPFILANEVCDRFAAAGFNANMVSYLTKQLHMPLVEATNTLNNFSGTSSLTPIIGAFIADSFAGRFWTITAGSIIYQLGMISLTISAVLPGLRPVPCSTPDTHCQRATTWQLFSLYVSLLFTAIGSGGIRPCVVAFGADQFELDKPRPTARKWNFFNFYFFSMGLAVLLALTVVVYIQDNVGWGWGFGIPTIAMFISVIAFVIGYPLYIRLKPGGAPFTRLTQVVVAAIRKRKLTAEFAADSSSLFVDKVLDADISAAGRLVHTNQLRFLDKAAIVTPGNMTESGQPRPWRLSTVHRVEELKSILRMIPIWSVGILIATAASHNHTFAIIQAKSMDRHLSHNFEIPAATMSIFTVAAMLFSLGLYDRVFIPIARRFTGRPSGITCLQRIGIGLAIAILANISAAVVETKRKAVAASHGLLDEPDAVVPISVFWLVPQYAISGVAEAFASVGHMEFLYDQAPESMRSTAAALFWLAASAGSYMGTVLVTLVNDCTKKKGSWVQDNINRGKLDCYYWLVCGLQVINLGYYLLCAMFYTFKPLEVVGVENCLEIEEVGGEDGGGDLELANLKNNFQPEGMYHM